MVLKELYDRSIRDDIDVIIKAFVKGNIEDIEEFIKEKVPMGTWLASEMGEALVGYFALSQGFGEKIHPKVNPFLLGLFEDGIEDIIAGAIPLKEWLEKIGGE